MLSFPCMEGKLMLKLLTTLREEFSDKLKMLSEMAPIPREIQFEEIYNKISVFIGIRRSGKTIFLFQLHAYWFSYFHHHHTNIDTCRRGHEKND